MEKDEKVLGIQWVVTQEEKDVMDILIDIYGLESYEELLQNLLNDAAVRTLAQKLLGL